VIWRTGLSRGAETNLSEAPILCHFIETLRRRYSRHNKVCQVIQTIDTTDSHLYRLVTLSRSTITAMPPPRQVIRSCSDCRHYTFLTPNYLWKTSITQYSHCTFTKIWVSEQCRSGMLSHQILIELIYPSL